VHILSVLLEKFLTVVYTLNQIENILSPQEVPSNALPINSFPPLAAILVDCGEMRKKRSPDTELLAPGHNLRIATKAQLSWSTCGNLQVTSLLTFVFHWKHQSSGPCLDCLKVS
jgi:hypothetical protein